MASNGTLRRRLAVGVAALSLASTLVLGVASVAADNDTPEPRDVNVGKEATGLADDTRVSITEVVTAPAASNDPYAVPTTPVVADPDDHRD
jgi:hypothetical protein